MVFVPVLSRIPNRNRFGPTTASDDTSDGMNGGFAAADDGLAAAELPPDVAPQAVTMSAIRRTQAGRTRRRTRAGGCTRASYPGALIDAFEARMRR